jgi:type I restriction enzyme S subunit
VRSLADEVPFDIPDSWEWVRFGNIVANYDSKRRPVTKEQRKNEHGYYDYYGATGAIDRVDDYIFEGEYLMIGEDGGNFFTERDNAFIASGRFWANNHVHIVQPILCDIHFLKHFLDSCNLPKMGLINGIAVPKLNQEHLNSILVPLPPLSEQEAIVAELSKYAPLLDEYQLAYSEIKLLNDSFPERLKKSILQEAVQGKLVPQDPSDEPAEALLERIRAEKQRLIKEGKIKKDKHESVIFRRDNSHYEKRGPEEVCIDEEIPFEIPENWAWCRASSLGTMIRGRGIKRTETVAQGRPCIRYGEIYTTYETSFDSAVSFVPETLDKDCLHFSSGDVVFTLTGENKVDIAKTVAFLGEGQIAAGGDLAFWTHHGMNPLYLVYYMASPYCIELKRRTATGDIIVHISTSKVGDFLVPIPPIKEQNRIVSAIEQLFAVASTL